MVKVRSLREALAYIRTLDQDTGISANAVRMLVVSGKIPSVKIGRKYLVDVDLVIEFFEHQLSRTVAAADPESIACDDIKPIPERLRRKI
ncbi:MAG: hypothetical protein ACYC5K_09555 [Saccharofermentanales bacterium]